MHVIRDGLITGRDITAALEHSGGGTYVVKGKAGPALAANLAAHARHLGMHSSINGRYLAIAAAQAAADALLAGLETGVSAHQDITAHGPRTGLMHRNSYERGGAFKIPFVQQETQNVEPY
jgi:hypothetical protein